MTEQLKTALDEIFVAHDEKKRQLAKKKSERELIEQAFVDEFYKCRDSIIRPTFEAIGEYVKTKGYNYRIDTVEEQRDRDGRYQSPSISIIFLLGGGDTYSRINEYPHLTVNCSKSSSTLTFFESTMSPGRGGHSGSAGETTPNKITAELINAKVVAILKQVFA